MMKPRDGTKSLPVAQIEAARAFVRDIVDREFNGNVSATAKKLDIAH